MHVCVCVCVCVWCWFDHTSLRFFSLPFASPHCTAPVVCMCPILPTDPCGDCSISPETSATLPFSRPRTQQSAIRMPSAYGPTFCRGWRRVSCVAVMAMRTRRRRRRVSRERCCSVDVRFCFVVVVVVVSGGIVFCLLSVSTPRLTVCWCVGVGVV
jgi:hypothetical protein